MKHRYGPKVEKIDLTKEFKSRPSEWRIEAVIHDGVWYDKPKWAKVAKVSIDELNEWMDKNKNILIKSDNSESYRVNYKEVIRWYKEQDIPVEAMIVPKNFPPKLWCGMTETEAFLQAPRRTVGTISFRTTSNELLDKIKGILNGVAKVFPDKKDRYKAYGLSAAYIKQLLSLNLTKEELASLDLKTRALLMQRELIDFPSNWLDESLVFYISYAETLLKPAKKTLEIYLPEDSDIQAQIVFWVMAAMKKFDETQSVPFSGYLASALRHWPYDLPDEYLGKDLSDFQRNRSRAIKEAEKFGYETGSNVPIDLLAQMMNLTIEQFVELQEEHNTWTAVKNYDTLNWEESANEKAGTPVGLKGKHYVQNAEKASKISRATIVAAISSGDWNSAYKVIKEIDKETVDANLAIKLSPKFIQALANAMQELKVY